MLKGQVCELGMNALLEFAFHVLRVYCTIVEKMLFRAWYFVLVLQIGNRVHAVVDDSA